MHFNIVTLLLVSVKADRPMIPQLEETEGRGRKRSSSCVFCATRKPLPMSPANKSQTAMSRKHNLRMLDNIRWGIVCVVTILAVSPGPAAADPVEDFYKGRQIRIVIRAAPGGN